MNFPTKSGTLGLVCAAMGAGGQQTDLLKEFSELDQTVYSFARKSVSHNGETVKTVYPPLRDFQMVGSGYNDTDPWEKLLIPKTADGKKAVGSGSKLTYRYYLQDAAFAVIMEVPEHRASSIAESIQNPVWDIHLGRKTCVPSDYVFRGLFSTVRDAAVKAMAVADEKDRILDFRVVGYQAGMDAAEVITLSDVPVQFGDEKLYRDRRVAILYGG